MVRTYKRKTDRGNKYSSQDINKALEDIKAGRSTVKGASKTYGIPSTTLYQYHKGLRKVKSKTQGRTTAIPEKDELKLAQCLKTMEKWGYGLTRSEVFNIVGTYVQKNYIKTNFKNNIPGEDWFLNFKKRHRLSLKKPEAVEYARRKAIDPFIINKYFDLLEKTISDLKLETKPRQIYNLDETSFCTDPSKTKVVGGINSPATRTTSGPGKENKTVLFGGNALGEKLPPLIIFTGKNMWDEWMAPVNDGYPNTAYAATSKGWMESDVFASFIEHTFIPNATSERPILIIFDGHSTHIDERVIDIAVENDIHILKLPPHSSHVLQPLDLSCFKSLKSRWDVQLVKWQRQHIGQKLSKKTFSILIGKLWSDTDPEILRAGFEKGGIVPFNRNVIAKEKYDPMAWQRWENRFKPVHTSQCQTPTTATSTSMPTSTVVPSSFELVSLPGTSSAGPSTSKTVCIPTESKNNHISEIQSKSMDSSPNKLTPVKFVHSRHTTNNTPLKRTPLKTDFETLLLSEIKQKEKPAPTKKKRVAIGAEVITAQKVSNLSTDKKGKYLLTKPSSKVPTSPNTQKPKKGKLTAANLINRSKSLFKGKLIPTRLNTKNPKEGNNHQNINHSKNLVKRKIIKREHSSSSEVSVEDFVSDRSDSPTVESMFAAILDEEKSLKDELISSKKPSQKKVGDWVLVQFKPDKTVKNKHFVGQIIFIDEVTNEATVKFTRKRCKEDNNSTSFVWPTIDDCSSVPDKDLLVFLEEPKPGRRGELIFSVSFWTYNVQ